MSESLPLPTEPEGVIPSLVERFNSGKVEVMMALYAPEAVFIANDGRIIRDRTEIAAQFRRDMSLGLPLKANVRHVFVGDDTAQIVVDWSIDGKRARRQGRSPRRLGKRYRAPRRGRSLAVHYRQQSRDGIATARLTYVRDARPGHLIPHLLIKGRVFH
jgi:hypothetical protein